MSNRFDELTKALGQGLTRRQALGRFAAFVGGTVAGLFALPQKAKALDAYTCGQVCRGFVNPADRNRCLGVCLGCPSLAQLCGSSAATLACYPASALINAVGLTPVGATCVPVCRPGFGNCDNNTVTGCETNLSIDPNNCGFCGGVCSGNNMATRTCGGGVCNGTCAAGFADCNGNKGADGCEVNTSNNVNNCGGCGNVCFRGANVAAVACANSTCVITACNFGFANCNGFAGDGCETNILNNNANCGGCGIGCTGGRTCSNGSCV